MEDLAKRAKLNGEVMSWSYGAVPNKKEVSWLSWRGLCVSWTHAALFGPDLGL